VTRELDVRYRSVNALLVAYAARLAHGEIFLEAAQSLPLGTRTLLRLHAPGSPPLQIEGVVAWARLAPLGPGLPAGAAIAILSSLEAQGAVIDDLAARFRRIRMLVVSAETTTRTAISRYLRSILTCDLIESGLPFLPDIVGKEMAAGLDLVLMDLDDQQKLAVSLLPQMVRSASTAAVPLIALAQQERDRAAAAALGVNEVLNSPPSFSDVRGAVMHALGSPALCTIR